jgi:hypothetical protein
MSIKAKTVKYLRDFLGIGPAFADYRSDYEHIEYLYRNVMLLRHRLDLYEDLRDAKILTGYTYEVFMEDPFSPFVCATRTSSPTHAQTPFEAIEFKKYVAKLRETSK